MELVKVNSSNISKIGWDETGLYVEYTSGLYLYEGVKKEVYDKLLLAESKGKFVGTEIKNKYNFKKLK